MRPHTHSPDLVCSWCSQPFAVRFVIESAAIERQTIPPSRVAGSAHFQAYLQMILLAASKAELQQRDLKNWQAMIGREQHLWGDRALPQDLLGQYREWDIGLGMPDGSVKSIGAQWTKVADEMDNLWDLTWNNGRGWTGNPAWTESPAIEKAAVIHHMFERIHPFGDGNGRSGRLLALWVLRVNDEAPVLFENWDKATEYYPCFEEKFPDRMIEYFKSHQIKVGYASDDPWL